MNAHLQIHRGDEVGHVAGDDTEAGGADDEVDDGHLTMFGEV